MSKATIKLLAQVNLGWNPLPETLLSLNALSSKEAKKWKLAGLIVENNVRFYANKTRNG